MPRLVAAYTVFSLLLFGALFAAFYVSGLGVPSEDWSPEVPSDAGLEPPPPPVDPIAAGLDYPALSPGETYRVSHATKLYEEPAEATLHPSSLPARGFFTLQSAVDVDQRRWYRVTVSDGVRDYTRYVLAKDLNFKRVVAVKAPEDTIEARRQAAIEQLEAMGRERRARRLAANPPPPPEPRTPESFDEWWSMTADRLGGATAATAVASGVAAAIATALTLGSILTIIALRREHTWDRPPMHDLDAEWEDATEEQDYADNSGDSAGRRL